MITLRWWLLTVAGTGAGMIAILVAVGVSGPQLVVGTAIAVGYIGLFLALRSRIHEGDRWATVFIGATVLWAAGLTAVSPERRPASSFGSRPTRPST